MNILPAAAITNGKTGWTEALAGGKAKGRFNDPILKRMEIYDYYSSPLFQKIYGSKKNLFKARELLIYR